MYEADGIDLTKSEYDELRNVERHDGSMPYAPIDESRWTCRRLSQNLRLINFDERAMKARLTRRGRDWIASYDHSIHKSHLITLREWGLALFGVVGGAVAGGFVTYLLFKLYGIT